MFCSHCGTNVESGQTFCSNCGQPLAASPTAPAAAPAPASPPSTDQPAYVTKSSTSGVAPSVLERHIKVLGILWIIYSGLRLIPGFAMLFLGRLRFLPLLMPVPGWGRAFVGQFLFGFGLLVLGFATLGVIAGVGLMLYSPWARILTIVLACINLIHLPFGTALGVYSLWVLFSSGADREYQRLRMPQAHPGY